MGTPDHAIALVRGNPVLQDRAVVLDAGGVLVAVVADGAGGVGSSERAAEFVIDGLRSLLKVGLPLDDEETWGAFLEEMDAEVAAAGEWGETTAVALAATDEWLCGASVGDSEAWIVSDAGLDHLTGLQRRKPLLGSGVATPVGFHRRHRGGVLVVGTDGLFKYASMGEIARVARDGRPPAACHALVELVRLRGGRLPDDVGVIVVALASPDGPNPGRSAAR